MRGRLQMKAERMSQLNLLNSRTDRVNTISARAEVRGAMAGRAWQPMPVSRAIPSTRYIN